MKHKQTDSAEEDDLNEYDVLNDTDDLDPFEINFLPQYKQGRGPKGPFVNQYGVIIGDHEYVSAQSPLEQWTENTDPSVMAGKQWVHPYKDIGFQTTENREYFEQGIVPQNGNLMHPDKNVAYGLGLIQESKRRDNPDKPTSNTD